MKGIFLDGATKKKVPSLPGRLIISLSKYILSKILSGTKSGTLPFGQKSQPFYGFYVKTKSSHGTISGKETITGPPYAPTGGKKKNPLSILCIVVKLLTSFGKRLAFDAKRKDRCKETS